MEWQKTKELIWHARIRIKRENYWSERVENTNTANSNSMCDECGVAFHFIFYYFFYFFNFAVNRFFSGLKLAF